MTLSRSWQPIPATHRRPRGTEAACRGGLGTARTCLDVPEITVRPGFAQ